MTHSGFNPNRLGRSREPITRFDPDALNSAELQAIQSARSLSDPNVPIALDEAIESLPHIAPPSAHDLRRLGALAFEQARRLER